MNWKLIFQLSVFGLIMAFGTVSLIPEKVEPAFWIVIFVICAYLIAKISSGKYFLHGVFVGLFNSIWITAVHIIFYSSYITHHPSVVKMSEQHPFLPNHPRIAMFITGPVVGLVSGIIIGLFAFITSKIVSKTAVVN